MNESHQPNQAAPFPTIDETAVPFGTGWGRQPRGVNLQAKKPAAPTAPLTPPSLLNASAALDEATATIARIKRETPKQEDTAPETPTPGYTIVYNPASLDSVFAASQLVACDRLNVVGTLAHSFMDDDESLLGRGNLLVCGTELSQAALEKLRLQGDEVTLFAYRDSYNWIDTKPTPPAKGVMAFLSALVPHRKTWLEHWDGRLKIVRQQEVVFHTGNPGVDAYTTPTLFHYLDNTAICMTYEWLRLQDMAVNNSLLRESRVTAARLVSLAFPVLPDETPVGDVSTQDWQERESNFKSILHHLLPSLRSALSGVNPRAKLRDVTLVDNEQAYLEHWRNIGRAVGRGCTIQPYRLGSTVMMARTLACPEMMHYDVLAHTVNVTRSLVTYEDAHGMRIWRVYAENRRFLLEMLKSLKGQDVWCEGPFMCTWTKVPEAH